MEPDAGLTPERLSEAEREIRQALALTSSRYVKRAYEGLDLLLRAARERNELERKADKMESGRAHYLNRAFAAEKEAKALREDVKDLAARLVASSKEHNKELADIDRRWKEREAEVSRLREERDDLRKSVDESAVYLRNYARALEDAHDDVKALAEAAEDVPRILRANGMPGDYANVLAVKVDAALARPGIRALLGEEKT